MTPDRDPPDLLREQKHHRPFWVRVLCFAGACIFFVLGILGWLIPVLTGIPFYVAGLALLGTLAVSDVDGHATETNDAMSRIDARRSSTNAPASGESFRAAD